MQSWKFSTGLLISFVVSVAVVVVFLAFATTPDEAQAERRPPHLGSPTAAVSAVPGRGRYVVPALALFPAAGSSYEVHPADGGPAIPVTIVEQRDGNAVVDGALDARLVVLLGRYDEWGHR